MPRYFFDFHDDEKVLVDGEGSVLADFEEARREARHCLPDIACKKIPHEGDHRVFAMTVRDEDGHPVYAATLSYTGAVMDKPN